MNNLGGRTGYANAAGVAVLIILTFFLQAAFIMPRYVCMTFGMLLLWNQKHSAWPLAEILYEGFDFLFALLVGALAMAAGRLLVPAARRPVMILGAAALIFLYAVVTILRQGKLPPYFFPIYLDLAAAVPGWLIGYYLAGGRETWEGFDVFKIAAVLAPAVVVVTALVIAPLYMPFYMPGAITPRPTVDSTFHKVQEPGSATASFMPPPAPPNQFDEMPTFHTVSPNGQ